MTLGSSKEGRGAACTLPAPQEHTGLSQSSATVTAGRPHSPWKHGPRVPSWKQPKATSVSRGPLSFHMHRGSTSPPSPSRPPAAPPTPTRPRPTHGGPPHAAHNPQPPPASPAYPLCSGQRNKQPQCPPHTSAVAQDVSPDTGTPQTRPSFQAQGQCLTAPCWSPAASHRPPWHPAPSLPPLAICTSVPWCRTLVSTGLPSPRRRKLLITAHPAPALLSEGVTACRLRAPAQGGSLSHLLPPWFPGLLRDTHL